MKLSRKGEYACRAMLELSLRYGSGPQRTELIAKEQEIPVRYLEQILLSLRRAGFVRSQRGPEGGYQLARSPSQITIAEVTRAMDGPIAPLGCVSALEHDQCSRQEICGLWLLWNKVRDSVCRIMETTTFAEVAEETRRLLAEAGARRTETG